MTSSGSKKFLHLLWVAVIFILLLTAGFFTPAVRRLGSRFWGSLRVQKVQAVNVNLSNFVGPDANRTLQQMVSQMISDRVTVKVNEKAQTVPDAAAASKLAGFLVALLPRPKGGVELDVRGEHAFELTVDRSRLQAILKEAGRPDLVLPQSIDGATVGITIPKTVRARYGNCPGRPSATANIATPPPASMQYNDCLLLSEGPSPTVNVPTGLDVQQLAEVGLELAGMTPAQAKQFLETVNWQSTLGVSIPRFMRSYQVVKVNGVQGTLLDMAGRRGPTYTLLWAKKGIVYSLIGFGDSSDAVSLANSLR